MIRHCQQPIDRVARGRAHTPFRISPASHVRCPNPRCAKTTYRSFFVRQGFPPSGPSGAIHPASR
jgi:hypothetical protein